MTNSFFLLPFLALTICSPIEGTARIFFYNLETIIASGSVFYLSPKTISKKNHLKIATPIDFADSGIQTKATSKASKSAIHYTIASRLANLVFSTQLFHLDE